MRFADPLACPDCRGAISGPSTCPHCGLDLTSPEMIELWHTLQRADVLLEAAVTARDAARAASHPAPAAPAPVPVAQPVRPEPALAPPPSLPPYPAPHRPVKERRHVSAGAVLLGLGALGMVVAAFIFLTVSWGSLGVAGRALVLLAFTVVVGGAAAWATRRPLRGSAEAIWTIFLAMASLDWFVACDQGLLGLDGLGGRGATIVWAVAVVAASTTIVARGRGPLGADLVAPQVVAGLAVVVGASVVGVQLEDSGVQLFWALLVTAALAVAASVLLARLRVRVAFLVSGAFSVFATAACVAQAVVEVLVHPSVDDLVADGHGVPMLVVIAGVIAAGIAASSIAWGVTIASTAAGASAVFLLAVPSEESAPGRGALLVVAPAAVLGALLLVGAGPWHRGARLLTIVLAAGLTVVALGWTSEAVEAAGDGVWTWRSTSLTAGPSAVAGPWWLTLVVASALVSILLGAHRWPELARGRRHLLPTAWFVGAAGVVVTVASAEPAYVVTAATLMLAAVALAIALDRRGPVWHVVPPLGVGLALVASLSHEDASAVLWTIGAIVLAAMSTRLTERLVRDAVVLASAATAVGAVSFIALIVDVDGSGLSLTYVLTAAALAAVALVLRGSRGVPVEIVAAVTLLTGLLLAADQPDAAVRSGLLWLATVLLLGLSVGAGRDADAWWGADRAQAYRGAGVVTTIGAMLVAIPDREVSLLAWTAAAVVLAGLSWRVEHRVERSVVTVLSPLAAVGALGIALDLAGAAPQVFALSFVAAAAMLVLVAALVDTSRERAVEIAAGVTLLLALLPGTAALDDPLWRAVTWTAGGVVLLGASLLRLAWTVTDRATALRLAGAVAIVVAMLMPLPDARDSLGFWIGGLVVFAMLSWRASDAREAMATALVAAAATTGGAALALDLADATAEVSSVGLVVVAAVLCAAGAVEDGVRRLPAELVAAITAVVGLAVAIDGTSVAWVALSLTVLGALAVLLALLGAGESRQRRPVLRAIGAISLATAYVLRLVASDVGVVEAYTLPFGLVLLAAGAWALRGERSTSSLVALGPGLTLVLLPSLPQALADPTGPRALLLGVAALLALVLGAARTLQAPFVLGGLVFAVLVVVNVGPYAFALPRWALIGGAAALLLAAGATWEDRVRDGRATVRYVGSMR
jgi:hypothetical protein